MELERMPGVTWTVAITWYRPAGAHICTSSLLRTLAARRETGRRAGCCQAKPWRAMWQALVAPRRASPQDGQIRKPSGQNLDHKVLRLSLAGVQAILRQARGGGPQSLSRQDPG